MADDRTDGPRFVDTGSDEAGRITSGHAVHGVMETFEDNWWRDNYAELEELQHDRGYEYYRPAFRYGWDAYARYRGRPWTDVEAELASRWATERGESDTKWAEAKRAVRHAFDRATEVFQGK
jgi:hypothetical protein